MMGKRCRHELETKDGYPDDIICRKCETIWHISDYMTWSAYDLQHFAPKFIRNAVLQRQVEQFNKDNPNYYEDHVGEQWKPTVTELDMKHVETMWKSGGLACDRNNK